MMTTTEEQCINCAVNTDNHVDYKCRECEQTNIYCQQCNGYMKNFLTTDTKFTCFKCNKVQLIKDPAQNENDPNSTSNEGKKVVPSFNLNPPALSFNLFSYDFPKPKVEA